MRLCVMYELTHQPILLTVSILPFHIGFRPSKKKNITRQLKPVFQKKTITRTHTAERTTNTCKNNKSTNKPTNKQKKQNNVTYSPTK